MKSVRTSLSYAAAAIVAVAIGVMLFNLPPLAASPDAEDQSPKAKLVQTMNGDKDLNISVLGDSTGEGPNEWVDLWAMLLAADGASVHVRTWEHARGDWSVEPVRYGSGSRSITLWNGSVPGASPSYPMGFKDQLQPVKPDIVIASYGHDYAGHPGSLGTELTNLLDSAADRWGGDVPTVVTIQNPGQGSEALKAAEGQHAIRAVAQQKGLPVLDINEAFHSVGGVESLMSDAKRPSPPGSMLWASTVDEFFDE